MDTPAARLRYLRERQEINSAAQFARRLGIPEVTYRAHESGVRGFGEAQSRRYAEVLGGNWVWLLTGTGDPFNPAPEAFTPDSARVRPFAPASGVTRQGERSDLPVYASAEGGPSGMVVTHDPIDWVVRPEPLQNARDAFAVYVIGSSMEPRYEQGEMILVHPSKPAQPNDDVLLLSNMEGGSFAALIKRLVGWNDKTWTVRQYNQPREYELPRSDWPRAQVVLGRFNRR